MKLTTEQLAEEKKAFEMWWGEPPPKLMEECESTVDIHKALKNPGYWIWCAWLHRAELEYINEN